MEKSGDPIDIDALVALAMADDNPAVSLARLGVLLHNMDHKQEAREVSRRAYDLAPNDPEARLFVNPVLHSGAPGWHFRLVEDRQRNACFSKAFETLIGPDDIVLELGTGTGLLAMMAARAGAKHVYTCEADEDIARVARDIIARNGFADRITVIDAMSTDLKVGKHLPEPADILISDNFSESIVSYYDPLKFMDHAFTNLMKEDCVSIPCAATIKAAITDDTTQRRHYRMDDPDGFDLTPFNVFAPLAYSVGEQAIIDQPVSDVADLLSLTFAPGDISFKNHGRSEVTMKQDAKATAILQWFEMTFSPGNVLSTFPDQCAHPQYRSAVLYPFVDPINVQAGEALSIAWEHDQDQLRVWLDRPAG